MTTALGEVAYDFSSSANENPWSLADGGGGDPFVTRNGMTARIITNALRSDFNSNGYCCYVGQAIDQNDFEVKGETLQGGGSFGDQVGVGAINPSGNGYILWINGNLWRIYQIDAFVIGAGVNLALSHAALDVVSLQYSYSGGTATLTAKQNGSTVGLSLVDSTSPYNGNLEPCWYFNFDNSNAGGFRSIAIDGIAASVTIDTYPATVRSGSTGNAYTTTGLSSVSSITIGSLVGTSISDTTGDGTHSVPSLVDGVAHELYGTKTVTITGTGGAPTTTTNFQPATGNEFVTLSGTLNTSNTGGLYNFSPAAVVTDQIVFPDTANFNYDAQGNISGEAGTYNCWHIQASTKIARSYTVTLGNSGVSGVITSTLDNASVSASGTISVTGSVTSALANAVASVSGSVSITGSIASTLSSLEADLSGVVLASGSISSTLENSVVAASGELMSAGSISSTLDGAASSISGSIALLGSLSTTLDDMDVSISGAVLIDGDLSSNLDNASASVDGDISVDGGINSAMGDVDADIASEVLVSASISSQLDGASADISVAVGSGVVGSLNSTLSNATISIDGDALVTGSVSSQLASLQTDIDGAVEVPTVTGIISTSLANASLDSEGEVSLAGVISVSTSDVIADIEGDISVGGTISSTLANARARIRGLSGEDTGGDTVYAIACITPKSVSLAASAKTIKARKL